MAHLSDLHWVLLCFLPSFVGLFLFFEFLGMMSVQERLEILLYLRVSAWEDLQADCEMF